MATTLETPAPASQPCTQRISPLQFGIQGEAHQTFITQRMVPAT